MNRSEYNQLAGQAHSALVQALNEARSTAGMRDADSMKVTIVIEASGMVLSAAITPTTLTVNKPRMIAKRQGYLPT